MSTELSTNDESNRRMIFAALVEAQDQGESVEQSRASIAKKFGITATVVSGIEKEGLKKEWPPLGD